MEKCDPKDNSMISSAIWCCTSKFFEDNKIAQAHSANAICSLRKIYKCLLQQIAFNIMLLLVNNVHEKTSWRVRIDKILKASARYL